MVCPNEQLLHKEIEHLRNVFHHTNAYQLVIQNVISKFKEEFAPSAQSVTVTESHQDDTSKSYFLLTLTYKENREEKHFVALPKK